MEVPKIISPCVPAPNNPHQACNTEQNYERSCNGEKDYQRGFHFDGKILNESDVTRALQDVNDSYKLSVRVFSSFS